MDVEKILRTGYFDRVRIDGMLRPVYGSRGTVIIHNGTFKESLEKSEEAYKHGLAHLVVNIVGECDTNINFNDLEFMRSDRLKQGIIKLPSTRAVDRYSIAKLDIGILKSDCAIPFNLVNNGKTEDAIEKVSNTTDELELYLAALDFSKYITEKYGYSSDWVNIAVVDKVYVAPTFRRSGISTWVHENLADIVNMYGLVYPTGIVMTYGDFAEEADKLFGMNKQEYSKFLINHYESLGYRFMTDVGVQSNEDISDVLCKLMI